MQKSLRKKQFLFFDQTSFFLSQICEKHPMVGLMVTLKQMWQNKESLNATYNNTTPRLSSLGTTLHRKNLTLGCP